MSHKLKLYHLPGACSRVTMTALEHIGCEYDDVIVNILAGEQNSPDYKSLNPNGKVPTLLIDGEPLTENASILLWLHEAYPDAGLFPATDISRERAQYASDLFWLSAGWHPYVRANMMPVRWTVGDPEPVREMGRKLLTPFMEQLDARLSDHAWYYGDKWSIVDTYFYWCYTTAGNGGFPTSSYPHVERHRKDVEAQPAFQAAMAREALSFERFPEAKKSLDAILKK